MASFIEFYDDFMDFEARCVFYCDAVNALAAQHALSSRHGLSLHSSQLKAELEALRRHLRDLLDENAGVNVSPPAKENADLNRQGQC
jgi:hypothetical protein